jgi:hypothetical protein
MPPNLEVGHWVQRRPLSTFSKKDTAPNKFHRYKEMPPAP